MLTMDHKSLCALAVSWLKRPMSRSGPGCTVAISESANWINGEIPDAIGWRPYKHPRCGSIVVEVKISRADFLADAAKPHRKNPATGMGAYRYFLAPAGVISVEELPAKWGLIEVTPRGHMKVRAGHLLADTRFGNSATEDVWRHEHNWNAEICTLAMCLNRVGDPQQLQDRMRELGNINARLVKRNQELSNRNETLSWENYSLRNPDGQHQAARKRQVTNQPLAISASAALGAERTGEAQG